MSKTKPYIVYIDKHYGMQRCNVHKITIHYFVKGETSFNETQCWDCIKMANDKSWKKKQKAKSEVKEEEVDDTD